MITIKPEVIDSLIDSTTIEKDGYFEDKVKYPSGYLVKMKISDFLMLTTESNYEANEIVKDIRSERYRAKPGDPVSVWSQEIADSLGIDGVAVLAVDSEGQIHMHNGRHRAVIAAQSKMREIPVLIRCTDYGNELTGLSMPEQLKDQYHKGERKLVSFGSLEPIVLMQENKSFLVDEYSIERKTKDAVLAP